MKKETKSLDEIVVESESVVQPVEPKPKKRIGLGIMLVVLALLTVGGALALGYLWGTESGSRGATSPQPNNSAINIVQTESTTDCQLTSNNQQSDDEGCSCPELTFSNDAVVNKQENTAYSASISDSAYSNNGITVNAGTTGNEIAKVTVWWSTLDASFGAGKKDSSQSEVYEIKFDSNIVSILCAGFGQATGYETFLFLLENGTVEYMPVQVVYKTREVKSYGKLSGLADIRRLYQGSAGGINGFVGGGVTAFAQSADGKIYQLYTILKDAGAWD